ncbi:MAG TPA: tripartite tricarboxylate transporter substrate binding protein [Casimicrobium sp.]|jgi:tripartite-type tricarboxylate transporter receptor subunit TctC|nr:tripartite tricarboxylate transporter substrate binding protein [Casimicrobium sp.]HPT57272.1 tripartite tricarboxylate transporter substrate binding protein [Casimicrobium sp.]
MFKKITLACVSTLMLAAASGAWAQAYPAKPVKLLVGFPAGGGLDVLARIIGQRVSEQWGQQIIVENKPGAGSNIAGEIAAKSAPDGYTLLHTNIALMSINPALYGKMSFAPMKDLTPIVQLVNLPLAVMVRADSPFNSMKDLVDFARANPGKLNFGSGGNGGVPHLALELLNSSYNLKITHVPYKGSSDAVKDLLGGPIDVMCDAISVGLSQVKAGKLKALAVTTESRHPALPDTPTTTEAGYPKFQVTGWQGWVAPAGTPRAILDRVNAETNKAMSDPTTRAKLFEQGYLPAGGSVDAFAKQLAADQVKWAELVKVSGARID